MAPIFFLDKFVEYLTFEKRYSNHTITAYLKDIEQFNETFTIFSENMNLQIDRKQIRSWVVNLKNENYENSSINRKIVSLRSFFNFLQKNELVSTNPFKKIIGPKLKKRLPEFVPESDIKSEKIELIFKNDFEGVRDKLMFELLYQTGIRLTELIELKTQNVNSKQIKVLGKRNKERIIPISTDLHNLIVFFKSLKNSYLGDSDYLLTLINGNKLYPKLVYRKINYYLSIATNMNKMSPHVLRHTFATHMLNNGAGLETIKELLGHANLAATQIYTHNSFAELTNIYSFAHPRGRKKN